jgi:sugar fermentation stimulation protein A
VKFSSALIPATLLRRYKRFLADVVLENANNQMVTVHTPNTGAMLVCAEPGSRIWLRDSANPARKYRLGWELSTSDDGVLVGVNTHLANQLVREGIETGVIRELQGYQSLRQEVRYGQENSRVDLLLEHAVRPACYVEVKNVTLVRGECVAAFPDAVSQRGTRHLRELTNLVRQGYRAVLLFCVQRADAVVVEAARDIDPAYAHTLQSAVNHGVEVLAYQAHVTTSAISLQNRLPFRLV